MTISGRATCIFSPIFSPIRYSIVLQRVGAVRRAAQKQRPVDNVAHLVPDVPRREETHECVDIAAVDRHRLRAEMRGGAHAPSTSSSTQRLEVEHESARELISNWFFFFARRATDPGSDAFFAYSVVRGSRDDALRRAIFVDARDGVRALIFRRPSVTTHTTTFFPLPLPHFIDRVCMTGCGLFTITAAGGVCVTLTAHEAVTVASTMRLPRAH